MILYFHLTVILSVILSAVFLLRWNRNIAVHFPLIFLLIPIINVGYLKVATSQNIYEALIANGVEYFDGCFLELVFFLYIMSFCKLRIPKVLTGGLLAIGSVIFYFAINDSKYHMLYTTAELHQLDGVSYIVKEYGSVHTVYYVMIAFYLAANLAAIIYSFTRRNVSKINSLLLLIIYMMIIIAFLIGKSFHPAFELLPLSYTLSQIIFLMVMNKINLYDVTALTLTNISERGDIGFVVFDLKKRYLGCTGSAGECLPELNSMYVDKIISPDNDTFKKIIDCINKVQKGENAPAFYVKKNDVTYKVTASYMYFGDKIKGYQFMTEDNTEEAKRLEALELRERQKEMESEMLRLEKSASEAANRAKSTFLAQMSHEIRTPLNAIIGMDEMIIRESQEPNIREYAANIKSSGGTLLSIINGILDFSKIEDGKMEILPARYNTAVMINELVNGIAQRAESKGLELIVEADETLPSELLGDDVRIKQIISNLLTNAVKYTETGSVKLVMKAKSRTDSTVTIYTEVTDTGIGIKEEDREKLFESFIRLDETRNRTIEGTGLGMSIVTRLLNMMNSRLELKSIYGEGSTFSFELEQEIVNSEPMGNYLDHLPEIIIPDSQMRLYAPDARVLVVDDNAMNLKVAGKLIGIFGIKADTAGSGKEALDILARKQYDVIFLDHMMPEMDGIELLGEIRRRGLVPDSTSVIALTANAISGAKEMYISKGFNGYLTKPIGSAALERQLISDLPKSKISFTAPEKPQERTGSEHDILTFDEIKRIRSLCPQINIAAGMGNCMDQKDFWFDTLDGFVTADKSGELCKAFDSRDYELYRITVHSMKSACKTIGAELIAEKARLLENAARSGDTGYIEAGHGEFVAEYRGLIDSIKKLTVLSEEKA